MYIKVEKLQWATKSATTLNYPKPTPMNIKTRKLTGQLLVQD